MSPPSATVLVLFLTLLLLLFLYVFAVLRGWATDRRRHRNPIILRRAVNIRTLKGVQSRQATQCIRRARQLLLSGPGPALLHLDEETNRWVVCRGAALTVSVSSNSTDNRAIVEYCPRNPPRFVSTNAEEEVVGTAGCPPGLQEVRSAVPVSCIATEFPILRFTTLDAAAASMCRGPMDDSGTVHIVVGGARHHPVYYLVPVRPQPPPSPDGPVPNEAAHVWVQKKE